MRPLSYFALLFAFLAGSASAQRVYWSLENQTMGLGKANPLTLVFEECAPVGDIELPVVNGIEFGTPSISNHTTMVNFRTSRRVTYTYMLQPQQRGSVTIPTFSVQTDKGAQVVAGIGFEVGDASVGQTGISISDVVEGQLRVSKDTVWVGEVVEVEYLLIASGRYQASISSEPQWKSTRIVAEAFGQAERTDVTVRGERRPAVRYRTRFVATSPGRIALDAIKQHVTIQTGERSTLFFSQPRLEEFAISSNQPEIVVRALPQPAPASFTGAVGKFTLDSRIVPEQVRVGEPITWTLTLSGVGNWTSGLRLPQREVSADFEVVQPKSREENEDGRMFTGSLVEDAVLVPTKPGTYRLGPVEFSFFDTVAGKYVEQPVEPRTLEIQPAAAARSPLAGPAESLPEPGDLDSGARAPVPESAPPVLPGDLPPVQSLPRDPLDHPSTGFAPYTFSPAWWLFAAFIPPILTWLGLAVREFRRGDSVRVRRKARKQMLSLLRNAGRTAGEPSRTDLEQWRSLCIAMWEIRRAAPSASEVRVAIEGLRSSTTPAVWEELWQQCEIALFRPGESVGSEWIARALHAARQARIRRSTPGFPHRWRHWAPATASLLALAWCASGTRGDAAVAPVEAYREGRYAEARAGWLAQLATDPRDWTAHNNVGLAYAQEDRWPEAAAHWVAACLLNPRDASIRSNLTLALSRLDGVDPGLRRLVDKTAIDRAATCLSPGEWQLAFFAGAAVSAIGLVCMVMALYRNRNKIARRAGLCLAVTGLGISIASMFAETRYGMLASPLAGLVVQPTELRSIPTELTEKQQTTPLPPGTVVVLGRSFLGWNQVIADGGTTGWIRREVVTPFYRAPRPPLAITGAKASI